MNGNGAPGKGSIGNIVIMTVILCAIVASVIIIAFKLTGGSGDVTTTDPSLTTPPTTTAPVTTQKPSDGFKVENYTASDLHIGPLAIVNKNNAYDFEAQKDTGAKLYDTIPALDGVNANRGESAGFYGASTNTVSLRADVIGALNAMFAAYNADGGRTDIKVWIGYRSLDVHQGLYDAASEAAKKNMAAPGYSEYHTGYAFQLQIFTAELNSDPEDTVVRTYPIERVDEVIRWFNTNAHKYGFVLRYPAGNGNTDFSAGINSVFRYVGVPHATYMFNEGLCFEQYLKVLSETTYEKPLEIKVSDNEIYHVYFEAGEGDENAVHVPTDRPYSVSGNNSNGYIVTVNG